MTKNLSADAQLESGRLTRRNFLKLSGLAAFSVGGMMFLAGCGPAAQDSGTDDTDAADDALIKLFKAKPPLWPFG